MERTVIRGLDVCRPDSELMRLAGGAIEPDRMRFARLIVSEHIAWRLRYERILVAVRSLPDGSTHRVDLSSRMAQVFSSFPAPSFLPELYLRVVCAGVLGQ